MTKISIITATFNSEEAIQGVIQSLNAQSFQDFEWIVIDSLSNDKTIAKVQQSGIKSKHIVSEADAGIYDALNKGLRKAQGEYIIFFHSDDLWSDNKFLENYYSYTSKSVDVLYSNVYFRNWEGQTTRKWFDPWKSNFSIINGWMPPHVSMMVKTEIILKNHLFFDPNLRISADYDWILRLSELVPPSQWVYMQNEVVTMRAGGASNGDFSKYRQSLFEDIGIVSRMWPVYSLYTPIIKRLRKIKQWSNNNVR